MPDCDSEETDRAVAAYLRHAVRNGLSVERPDRDHSGRDGDLITPGHAGGVLGRYRVRGDGRLQWLGGGASAWPAPPREATGATG